MMQIFCYLMPNNVKMEVIVGDDSIPYCPFRLKCFILCSVCIDDIFRETVNTLDLMGWYNDEGTAIEGWYYEGGVGFGVLIVMRS